MIILENEIKRINEAKKQIEIIKECLWLTFNFKRDRKFKKRAI